MRLHEEIWGVDGFALARYTVAVNGGGYFEGVKAVGEFSPEKICLSFPRVAVEVEGENLSIAKYLDGDLRIDGKIRSVKCVEGQSK